MQTEAFVPSVEECQVQDAAYILISLALFVVLAIIVRQVERL
jgi:hypothetical protein